MILEGDIARAIQAAEKTLGEKIGYPALVYAENSAPADEWEAVCILGVWCVGANGHLFAKIPAGSIGAESLARRMASAPTLEREIQSLRLQLAAAHEHVGTLLTQEAGILECLEAGDPWPKSSRDSAAKHLRSAHDAARAWLRRSEPAGREA